jgi:hypothetical protein
MYPLRKHAIRSPSNLLSDPSYQMKMTITISTKGSANRNLSARIYPFGFLGQRIHRNSTVFFLAGCGYLPISQLIVGAGTRWQSFVFGVRRGIDVFV